MARAKITIYLITIVVSDVIGGTVRFMTQQHMKWSEFLQSVLLKVLGNIRRVENYKQQTEAAGASSN